MSEVSISWTAELDVNEENLYCFFNTCIKCRFDMGLLLI